MENELNIPGQEEMDRIANEFTSVAAANEDYANTLLEQEQQAAAATPPPAATEPEPSFVSETGAALVGGAADAVESVGGFAELTGDTLKTGFNYLFGRPMDDTQNPFDEDYVAGDGSWLDIPDTWVPENKTALGKLARGLVEFGFLSVATGGVGGKISAGLGVGAKAGAVLRAASVGEKGTRAIKFLGKGAKIASEGAIADLISSSSETANLANLIEDATPWMMPWVTEALAIDPEDNPWLARIKTVASGAGVNVVGHAVTAYAKGAWTAHRARLAGKTVEEAEELGNKEFAEVLKNGAEADEVAAKSLADDNYKQGTGIRTEEDAFKLPDPHNNPNMFDASERATVRPDEGARPLKQAVRDLEQGGEGRSYDPIMTESALRMVARGDKDVLEYVEEVIADISNNAFKSLDNTLDHEQVKAVIANQAADLTSMIEEGGDIAGKFQKYFQKTDQARIYLNGKDNKIIVGSPAVKAALQLTIHSLAKQAQMVATGALSISDQLPVGRQAEMVFDAMKVAITEHKKIGYLWGLDGKYQQINAIPKAVKEATEKGLKKVDVEMTEFRDALQRLVDEGRQDDLKALLEISALSGHKVRTMEHLVDYIRTKLYGGQMDGIKVQGRWRKELQGMFYNSILSAPLTPIKAIAGTNFVGLLRPFQAYLGASVGQSIKGAPQDHKQMAVAVAQIDAIGQALAEGFQMFKYNWDLGLNRKSMSYEGRFDLEADLGEWRSMGPMVENYGNATDKFTYKLIDTLVKVNTHPFMKYSQNAMGAGDALARTVIGRMEMRQRAALEALEKGTDPADVLAYAKAKEEAFRGQIFKKDANNRYVVHDQAAKMAGDEAALNRPLEGAWAGLEVIQRLPLMRAFFPFVRTGINAIDVTFDHTPLVAFKSKYADIMKGQNLEKYGLTEATLPQAQALMEGRVVMGSSIMTMAFIATLAGNMTGNYPYDKGSQDSWKAAGIQPFSFKFGDTYISYRNIEPFNTLFAMAADLVQNASILGESLTDNYAQKLSFMTAAVLVDKSMLSGVEDLAAVMSPDSTEERLKRIGARYVRSHFPLQGMLKSIGDVMDANVKEAQSFRELVLRQDGFFKKYVPPKYDILNKERTAKPLIYGPENPLLRIFNSLSPIPITVAEDDEVKKTLAAIRFNLPQALSTMDGVRLNAYEMSEFQKYMAQGDLRQNLESYFKSNSFRSELKTYKDENLTQGTGDDLINQRFYQDVVTIFENAKKAAKNQLERDNPKLARDMEIKAVRKKLGKAGEYERLLQWPKPTR